MGEALAQSRYFDHDDTLANVAEWFKTLCAERRLACNADLVRTAYDAVTRTVTDIRDTAYGRRRA